MKAASAATINFTKTNRGSQTFQEIRTENMPDGHFHPMKKPIRYDVIFWLQLYMNFLEKKENKKVGLFHLLFLRILQKT